MKNRVFLCASLVACFLTGFAGAEELFPAREGELPATTHAEDSAAGQAAAEEAGAPVPGSARFKADLERMKCFARDVPPFNPKISGNDPLNQYWFALLNWLVYFPPEEAQPIFKQVGIAASHYIQKDVRDAKSDKIPWLDDDSLITAPLAVPIAATKKIAKTLKKELKKTVTADTEAYWLDGKDYCVLVFRGTEPTVGITKGSPFATDVKTDLQSYLKRFGDHGRVHMGFYGALSLVWPQIQAKIGSGQCRDIYVTGHSLGGALARLTGVALLDRQLNDPSFRGRVASVQSIASPRVGDREFERTAERQIRETNRLAKLDPSRYPAGATAQDVRNEGDIVARVPFRGQGFADSMHTKLYDRNNAVAHNRDGLRKSGHSFLRTLMRPQEWYDNHSLDVYLVRIATEMGLDKGDCLPPKRLERALGKTAFRERQAAQVRMKELAQLGHADFQKALGELAQEAAKIESGKQKKKKAAWPQDVLWYLCVSVTTPAACQGDRPDNYLAYRAGRTRPLDEKFYADLRDIVGTEESWKKIHAKFE